MRRWVAALVLPLVVSFALVGCGKNNSTTDTTGASTATTGAGSCPTTPQKTFVKTRFAADIGLIIGTTKHFIYTPYQQGKFHHGAHGRIFAIIKAAAAAAAVVHLTHNAIDNAKADPLLCKVLVQPLRDVVTALDGLKSKLLGGDFSSVTNLGGTLGGLESAAKGQGLQVVSGLIPGL